MSEDDRPKKKQKPPVTSLATAPEIANRVKEVVKAAGPGVTLLEVNNKLLLYALEYATIDVERQIVKVHVKDVSHGDSPTPIHGRRKRKT